MTSEHSRDSEDRLGRILLDLMEASEAARPVDRSAVLAAHPEFASELVEYFDNREEIERVTAPLRQAVTGSDTLVPGTRATTPGPPTTFGDYELLGELGRGGM